MTSKTNWFDDSYNDFVKQYGGKWVLINQDKVIFANESFEIVFIEYKKVRDQPDTEIVLIDDGEASFYAIANSN